MLLTWSKSSRIKSRSRYGIYLILCMVVFLNSCSQKVPVVDVIEQPVAKAQALEEELTGDDLIIKKQQLYQRGIDALNSFDDTAARQIFQQFIDKYPTMSGAYVNLALIAYRQDDFPKAVELVNQTLDLNPSQAEAYHLRAQLQINNGNINDAREDYLKALQIKPNYGNAHYNLALLYDIYLQDIQQASIHYEIYLSLPGQKDEATKDWVNHLKGILKNG